MELSDVAEAQGLDLDLIALNDALEKLQGTDSRAAEWVKLRFFAGLTRQEASEALGIERFLALSANMYWFCHRVSASHSAAVKCATLEPTHWASPRLTVIEPMGVSSPSLHANRDLSRGRRST